jgi:hypothetical protein
MIVVNVRSFERSWIQAVMNTKKDEVNNGKGFAQATPTGYENNCATFAIKMRLALHPGESVMILGF